MESPAVPIASKERIYTLDVIRGFALPGIFNALDLVLAIGIFFVVQVPLSKWWLARHELGPMEWLWRRLTCGRSSLPVQHLVGGQHQQ